MQILSVEDRSRLLKALEAAPDEILIDAVNQYKDQRSRITGDFKALHGYLGIRVTESPAPKFSAATSDTTPKLAPEVKDDTGVAAPVNKNPPGAACSRVGSETKETILAKCTKPSTLEEINKFLLRGLGKIDDTRAVLKLLWERNELTFDGERYRRAT